MLDIDTNNTYNRYSKLPIHQNRHLLFSFHYTLLGTLLDIYTLIQWEHSDDVGYADVALIDPLKGERPEYSGCSKLGLEHGQVHAYAVAAAQGEGDEDLLEPAVS